MPTRKKVAAYPEKPPGGTTKPAPVRRRRKPSHQVAAYPDKPYGTLLPASRPTSRAKLK